MQPIIRVLINFAYKLLLPYLQTVESKLEIRTKVYTVAYDKNESHLTKIVYFKVFTRRKARKWLSSHMIFL